MKTDGGNAVRFRKPDLKQGKLRPIMDLQIIQAVFNHGGFHLTDILKAVNISHFKIHTGIFVQMPCRIMFFRPEYRSDFKNPFIDSHHHLFVKLRALGEIGVLAEIIQTENIGTAFRSLVYDFRCADLRKFFLFQKSTKAPAKPFLYFKNSALFFIPQGQGPVIQQRFQGCVNPFAVNHNRHFLCRFRKYGNPFQMKFPTGFGAGFLHHKGIRPDTGFFF